MKFVQVLRSLSLGPQPRDCCSGACAVGARRPGHRPREDGWQEACAYRLVDPRLHAGSGVTLIRGEF